MRFYDVERVWGKQNVWDWNDFFSQNFLWEHLVYKNIFFLSNNGMYSFDDDMLSKYGFFLKLEEITPKKLPLKTSIVVQTIS